MPTNWILCGNKKWSSNSACYNMNGPWEHYTQWKKPVSKDHILHGYICKQLSKYKTL